MTPPPALAPEDVLHDGLSVSRKRKRRTEPTKESNKRRRPSRLEIPYFPSSSCHSPRFWDHLKIVFLTRGALKELDRRNASNPKPDPSRTRNKKNSKIAKRCLVTSNQSPGLERFSRTGGPDLTDLRGYSYQPSVTMPRLRRSAVPPPPRGQGDSGHGNIPSDGQGNLGAATNSSASDAGSNSPYDLNFQANMEGLNVTTPSLEDKPDNFDEWLERLRQPRESKPTFHDQFLEFNRRFQRADDENRIMADVYPLIEGDLKQDAWHHSRQDKLCTTWAPFTETYRIAQLKPDVFDGIRPSDYVQLGNKLSRYVLPATTVSPKLPNFFGEFKGRDGTFRCVELQAMYDGAMGARAMHKVQNYGKDVADEVYDNNAYTVTFTFLGATLTAHLHFIRKPERQQDYPHYVMTLLDSWTIRTREAHFTDGVTAFRNARDMAHEFREQFAEEASGKIEDQETLSEWLRLGDLGKFSEKENANDDDDIPTPYDSQASYLNDPEESSQSQNDGDDQTSQPGVENDPPTNSRHAGDSAALPHKRQKSADAAKTPTKTRPGASKIVKSKPKSKVQEETSADRKAMREAMGLRKR